MMIRAIALAFVLTPSVTLAQDHDADVQALADALQLPQVMDVIRLEGIAYGAQIADDMFPDGAPREWDGIVAEIYDTETLTTQIVDNLAAELEGEDITPMLEFFTSDPGQTIMVLEAEARRARLDPDVEQSTIEMAALAAMEQTPRFQQIETLIEANDLIESNVVAAMNFNYAFFLGIIEGGAMGRDVTEGQILSDVWAQEPMIRAQTTEWMYSFYLSAYQTLPDADVDIYQTFALSTPGQTLDDALVKAFEPVFLDISRALGLAAGEMMMVQEL